MRRAVEATAAKVGAYLASRRTLGQPIGVLAPSVGAQRRICCCLAVLVVPASPYLVAAARRYGVVLKDWTVTLRCAHRHAP